MKHYRFEYFNLETSLKLSFASYINKMHKISKLNL